MARCSALYIGPISIFIFTTSSTPTIAKIPYKWKGIICINSDHGFSDKLSAASWVAIRPVVNGAYTLIGDIEATGLPIQSTMYASLTRDLFKRAVIGRVIDPR